MTVFPIGEYRVVDDLEAIVVISQHFPGGTEENHKKPESEFGSFPACIRTERLQITSPER
jgi:hypothetical protein